MMAWLWLGAAAWAASGEVEPEVVEALEGELQRVVRSLALPEAPDIYHLRYKLGRVDATSAWSSFGGVVRSNHGPENVLGIELRVGTPEFDNTGFGGFNEGFRASTLPIELTGDGVRHAAWTLAESAYKDAVEHLSRKEAHVVREADHPGDYLAADGSRVELPGGLFDATLDAEARSAGLSSRFLAYPQLEVGAVHVAHEAGSVWIVDSEGARIRRPIGELTIRALAHHRAPDGMLLTDQRLWTRPDPNAVPSTADMRADIDAMAEGLLALADAPTFPDEYVGPVIFEGDAAADVFRYLLLPQLEGTPPSAAFETEIGDLRDSRETVRVGRRVLPRGWSVIDDPGARPGWSGWTAVDWEGVSGTRVALVDDGVVRDVLMSRTPRPGRVGSNGHGRASFFDRAVGKPTQTFVEPRRTVSKRVLHRKAMRAASDYGLDHYVVVRRFQEPSTRDADGAPRFSFEPDEGQLSLPLPVDVWVRRSDGSETRHRGVRVAAVHRWVLRDVMAAGAATPVEYLSPYDGRYDALGPTGGTPSLISAPSVLIGELELVPTSGDPKQRRIVPPPDLAMSR